MEFPTKEVHTMAERGRVLTTTWVLIVLVVFTTRAPFAGEEPSLPDRLEGLEVPGVASSSESRFRFQTGRQSLPQFAALGAVEGVRGDLPLRDGLRLGAMVGFRPEEDDPTVAAAEKTLAAAFLSAGGGEEKKLYHQSTLGVVGRLTDGELDRLALLLRQETDLGAWLRLLTGSAVELPGPTRDLAHPLHVSRLDVTAISPITSFLTLQFGVEHDGDPVKKGSHDGGGHESAWGFQHGSWRYWGRASQRLFWGLKADAEVAQLSETASEEDSLIGRAKLSRSDCWGFEVDAEVEQLRHPEYEGDSLNCRGRISKRDCWGFELDAEIEQLSQPGDEDTFVGWRAKVSKRDLPGLQASRVTATIAKPGPPEVCDGRLQAHFPFLDTSFSLRPGVNVCYSPQEESESDFRVTEFTLGTGQEKSSGFDFRASFSYSFVEVTERVSLDLGLQSSW